MYTYIHAMFYGRITMHVCTSLSQKFYLCTFCGFCEIQFRFRLRNPQIAKFRSPVGIWRVYVIIRVFTRLWKPRWLYFDKTFCDSGRQRWVLKPKPTQTFLRGRGGRRGKRNSHRFPKQFLIKPVTIKNHRLRILLRNV